jgi:hypothetical protein
VGDGIWRARGASDIFVNENEVKNEKGLRTITILFHGHPRYGRYWFANCNAGCSVQPWQAASCGSNIRALDGVHTLSRLEAAAKETVILNIVHSAREVSLGSSKELLRRASSARKPVQSSSLPTAVTPRQPDTLSCRLL